MTMWAMLRPSEDGEPFSVIDVHAVLADPEGYGVSRFEDWRFLAANTDPQEWPEGTTVLLRCEVVVPEAVTTAFRLPNRP